MDVTGLQVVLDTTMAVAGAAALSAASSAMGNQVVADANKAGAANDQLGSKIQATGKVADAASTSHAKLAAGTAAGGTAAAQAVTGQTGLAGAIATTGTVATNTGTAVAAAATKTASIGTASVDASAKQSAFAASLTTVSSSATLSGTAVNSSAAAVSASGAASAVSTGQQAALAGALTTGATAATAHGTATTGARNALGQFTTATTAQTAQTTVDNTATETATQKKGFFATALSTVKGWFTQTTSATADNAKATEDNGNKADSAKDKVSAFSATLRTLSDTINVVRASWDVLKGVWDFASDFINAGAAVETYRVQLGGLLGDYQKADTLLEQLRDYANHSQLTFPQVVEAEKQLYTVTSGLQAIGGNLQDVTALMKKVGDSTPDATKYNEIADSIGRLYIALQSGTRYEEPLKSLAGMGVVAGSLSGDIQRMVAQGATLKETWSAVTDSMSRSEGNAARLSTTYKGLSTTLGDAWANLQQRIGEPLSAALKQPVIDLTAMLADASGPAAAFGTAMGRQIQIFYGLFKNGELGDYISAETERGVDWFVQKWNDAVAWVGATLHTYLLDPLSGASFGSALSQTFTNIGTLLKSAFDDGVSSFRAGMSVAVGELDIAFTGILNGFLSHLPRALGGGGPALEPASSSLLTYAAYKGQYSQNDTKAPDSVFAPLGTAVATAAKSLLGLGETVSTTETDFAKFGGLDKGVATGANPIATFGGVTPPAVTTALQAFDTATVNLNGATANIKGMMTGNGSEVFGTNMDGSLDMTDASMGRNAHLGSYRETNLADPSLLGAAVSPQQASDLTGIADNTKAMATILGQYLNISYNGHDATAQVVDTAPNSNKGIELTPAAHRAVGDYEGDANIQYGLGTQGGVAGMQQRAIDSTTVGQADAGKGFVQALTAEQQALQQAQSAATAFNVKIDLLNTAQKEYTADVNLAKVMLDQGLISQSQYTAEVQKAQEKLEASNATWQQVAASIGLAAAKQAQYNAYVAQMKPQVQLGTATAGQSVEYGAKTWANEQGSTDAMIAKGTGDALNTAATDTSNFFSALTSGSVSATQAFKNFATSIGNDISAMVVKMLILKALQEAIGMATGGGGGGDTSEFGSAAGSGFSQGDYNDIMGAASVQHNGGEVGPGNSTRMVSMSLFNNAARYHTGLAGDEFPAILQRGETVIPKGMQVQPTVNGNTNIGDTYQVTVPVTYNEAANNGDGSGNDQKTQAAANLKSIQTYVKKTVQDGINEYSRQRMGGSRKNA